MATTTLEKNLPDTRDSTETPNLPAVRRDFVTTRGTRLSPEQVEAIGVELDAIRDEVMSDLGTRDAAYIRGIIRLQRKLELYSRVILLFSLFPPAWIVGTAGLSLSKILENMEIGHNVLHGQWDWMRDPKINSTTWEWDFVTPARQWKASHNEEHHRFTNVIDRDHDLGYGIMRVDEHQEWEPGFLLQPVVAAFNAVSFDYGIAAYDMGMGPFLRGEVDRETFLVNLREVWSKVRRQLLKEYVIHPLLSGPSFLTTIAANAVANLVRNVWSNSVIICGHFPEGVETFPEESLVNETRGQWYVRQMLGSANISGSKKFHILAGNLSHQIEHHLYPDMPSNRLGEVAPRVQEVFAKYGLEYVTGPMHRQLGSVWGKIFKLSLPNPEPGRSRIKQVGSALGKQVGGALGKIASSRAGVGVRRRLKGLQPAPALTMG